MKVSGQVGFFEEIKHSRTNGPRVLVWQAGRDTIDSAFNGMNLLVRNSAYHLKATVLERNLLELEAFAQLQAGPAI